MAETDLDYWRGTVDAKLNQILDHVTQTNGHVADALLRIHKLEKNAATAEGVDTGVRKATRWIPHVLTMFGTVGCTIAVMALSGGIHL